MSNSHTHWAASIVDAILKRHTARYYTLTAAARAKLRADMLSAIDKQLKKTLEAELSMLGRLKYKRTRPTKQLDFLIGEVAASQDIFENVVKSFIMKFA